MSESDFRTEGGAVREGDADTEQITDEALERAEGLTVDPDVRENYQAAAERGANVEGEGQIP